MKRKGWFVIPGVQEGERTLEEQMTGIMPALEEAASKTVLDLGCAEGLIGREFAHAGAAKVIGVESLRWHIEVGREQCAGLPIVFHQAYLDEYALAMMAMPDMPQFDIVLSLGVCHKLQEPQIGIRYSAMAARELCLIRFPARPDSQGGLIRGKHFKNNTCDVPATMAQLGFELERTEPGPREEMVHYWRRKR